jgi:hypothetical protein
MANGPPLQPLRIFQGQLLFLSRELFDRARAVLGERARRVEQIKIKLVRARRAYYLDCCVRKLGAGDRSLTALLLYGWGGELGAGDRS